MKTKTYLAIIIFGYASALLLLSAWGYLSWGFFNISIIMIAIWIDLKYYQND